MARSMKPEILIVGHQWWWEIHYLNNDPSKEVTTANELHSPAGKPANIRLETRDVMHSFWIPALHGKVDLISGMPNYIRIEASQPGEYTGQCAEFCGEEHARMRLLAIVQPQDQYDAWLNAQIQPGHEPCSDDAKAGEQLFLTGPCSNCHQVRGTLAGGTVAPDLTHVGSHKIIASDVYQQRRLPRSMDHACAVAQTWLPDAQYHRVHRQAARSAHRVSAPASLARSGVNCKSAPGFSGVPGRIQ